MVGRRRLRVFPPLPPPPPSWEEETDDSSLLPSCGPRVNRSNISGGKTAPRDNIRFPGLFAFGIVSDLMGPSAFVFADAFGLLRLLLLGFGGTCV